MNKDYRISQAAIRRIPRYRRILEDMMFKGIERISSKEMGDLVGYTASQVRQDLNIFGGFGQQGYGYNVKILFNELTEILGLNFMHTMVVAGIGHLGHAIVNYICQYDKEFEIKALFDSNPNVIGSSVGGIEVLNVKNMSDFLQQNPTEIGVITASSDSAQSIADQLAEGAVKGIWNFSIAELNIPEEIVLQNVRISDSLHSLAFCISSDVPLRRA